MQKKKSRRKRKVIKNKEVEERVKPGQTSTTIVMQESIIEGQGEEIDQKSKVNEQLPSYSRKQSQHGAFTDEYLSKKEDEMLEQ